MPPLAKKNKATSAETKQGFPPNFRNEAPAFASIKAIMSNHHCLCGTEFRASASEKVGIFYSCNNNKKINGLYEGGCELKFSSTDVAKGLVCVCTVCDDIFKGSNHHRECKDSFSMEAYLKALMVKCNCDKSCAWYYSNKPRDGNPGYWFAKCPTVTKTPEGKFESDCNFWSTQAKAIVLPQCSECESRLSHAPSHSH